MTPPRNESGRPWTADDVIDIDAASVRNAERADSMPEMTTYEDEFGGEVADGYSFVTGTEWFDDCDEPVRLIRRHWVCVEEEVGTYWSSSAGLLCRQCADDFDDCPTCDGDGCDPMRGAGWVPDTEPSAVTKPPTVAYCRTCGRTEGHWLGCQDGAA